MQTTNDPEVINELGIRKDKLRVKLERSQTPTYAGNVAAFITDMRAIRDELQAIIELAGGE
jgi:hypothetical protein